MREVKQISQETKLPTTMRNGLFGVKISGRLKDFPPRETAWRPAAMRNGLFRVKILDSCTAAASLSLSLSRVVNRESASLAMP